MTAIVSTYVPGEGFVVGADGLRTDAQTRVTVTDKARKIFFIKGEGIRLIYAWAGATSLLGGCGLEFNILAESAVIGAHLAANKPESIDGFVQQFAVRMYKKLKTICLPNGQLSNNPAIFPSQTIARVLFVGYYDEKPYQTALRFSHKDAVLQSPFMEDLIESPDDFNVFSGSAVVLEQLQPMEAPETLDDAAELIQKYLQTCIDNRANYVDCSSFGGNVQIATVTSQDFTWVIPPALPSQQ
jgi:hypothetical protein